MSSGVLDVSLYGDSRQRDVRCRNQYLAAKGDGATPVSVAQGMYGIASASSTSYELVHLAASESAVDSKIATLNIGINDGSTLNTLLSLNNTISKLVATQVVLALDSTYTSYFQKSGSAVQQIFTNAGNPVTLAAASDSYTVGAANTYLTGNLNVPTVIKNVLAEGAKFNMNDHATDPNVDFFLGNLAGSPVNPLTITKTLTQLRNTLHMNGNGITDTPLINNNTAALGSQLSLVSSATAPTASFILGNLAGSPSTPLSMTPTSVNVVGTLNVNGSDISAVINAAATWQYTGTTIQSKSAYNKVEINVNNAYSNALALDLNGSQVIRGNSLSMWDASGSTAYQNVYFDSASNFLHFRTSLATQGGSKDRLVFDTTTGTNNTYLERLRFDGGSGVQNATFSNTNVGIGGTPSGNYKLEVTGKGYFSDDLSVAGSQLNMLGNVINNASQVSNSAAALGARVNLVSDANAPAMQFLLGNLSASPTTILGLTNSLATLATDLTFSGTTANVNLPNASYVNFKTMNGNSRPVLTYNSSNEFKLTNQGTGGDVVVFSNNGTSGGETERLRVHAGSGITSTVLSNTQLGIGTGTTAFTEALHVTGTSNITSDLTVGGDVLMNAGSIDDVASINNFSAALGTQINLVTHATAPKFQVLLGDLAGSPSTVLDLSSSIATLGTPLKITTGDLNMNGGNVINSASISNSLLAQGAQIALTSHATDPTMNFLLGNLSGSPVTPLTLTKSSVTVTQPSTFTRDAQFSSTMEVSDVASFSAAVNGSVFRNDLTATSAGGTYLSLGNGTTGFSVKTLATNGTLSGTTSQFQVLYDRVKLTTDEYMGYHYIRELNGIESNTANTGGVQLNLTNGATPAAAFVLGNLEGTPTTVLQLTNTAATFNVPTTFGAQTTTVSHDLVVAGDLTVNGSTTTVNSTQVNVKDININLGQGSTTTAQLNGGGFSVGQDVAGTRTITYNDTNKTFDSSLDTNVATGKAVRVGQTDAVMDSTGLKFGSDAAALFLGGTQQWKMVMVTDTGVDYLQFQHYESGQYVTKFQVSAT